MNLKTKQTNKKTASGHMSSLEREKEREKHTPPSHTLGMVTPQSLFFSFSIPSRLFSAQHVLELFEVLSFHLDQMMMAPDSGKPREEQIYVPGLDLHRGVYTNFPSESVWIAHLLSYKQPEHNVLDFKSMPRFQ